MAGGLRYEVHKMPPGMRDKVVSQVLEKISAGIPAADPVRSENEGCLFEDCLRWGECSGADPECPYKTEGRLMPWPKKDQGGEQLCVGQSL